jgi:hypothetical protein
MSAPQSHSITHTGHRADGDAIQINGDFHGNLHLSERPREAGEPSPHECLRDLRVTDPRDDRARIEGDKDRLLRDCYAWILDDASFQRWREGVSRLLWIRGDPGKGKTMMTMGLIDELSGRKEVRSSRRTTSRIPKLKLSSYQDTMSALRPQLLAYFFCQNTQPELNNAVSVLRGLIYLLVKKQDQLLRHVQNHYNAVGSKLFKGPNAIQALKRILSDILNDSTIQTTYLLVDALDECTDHSALLGIITDDSLAPRSKVKWLVTSRNLPQIERYLQPYAGVKISLEVSTSHVAEAVAVFVNYKVHQLAEMRRYDATLQADVQQQLRDKANGTFLWVSLVCKELEAVLLGDTREVLQAMPTRLDPLYNRMMKQILAQKDVPLGYCKAVIRIVTLAFRPLHVQELVSVAGLPGNKFKMTEEVYDLITHCGSFLAVRDNTVSFIHLSAKDYFLLGEGQQVFDSTIIKEHGLVMCRLLETMRRELRRDLCGLEKPGAQKDGILVQTENSTLTKIAYACEYWVDHLFASYTTSSATSEDVLEDGGVVDLFLQDKFLYWLEALSLCKSVSKGIVSIEKLWSLIRVSILITIVAKTVRLTETRRGKRQARLLSL